jgi:hypothetical protein
MWLVLHLAIVKEEENNMNDKNTIKYKDLNDEDKRARQTKHSIKLKLKKLKLKLKKSKLKLK